LWIAAWLRGNMDVGELVRPSRALAWTGQARLACTSSAEQSSPLSRQIRPIGEEWMPLLEIIVQPLAGDFVSSDMLHPATPRSPGPSTRAPVSLSTHGPSPGLLCRPTVPHQGSCVDPRFLARTPVSTHGTSPRLLCRGQPHGPSRGLLCRGQPHGPSRGLLCRWHGLYPRLCLPPLSKFPYHRLHDVA